MGNTGQGMEDGRRPLETLHPYSLGSKIPVFKWKVLAHNNFCRDGTGDTVPSSRRMANSRVRSHPVEYWPVSDPGRRRIDCACVRVPI